jgi:hypothetical protein
MEPKQRIIIKFRGKKGFDMNQILSKLQIHFEKKVYALHNVQFWIGEVRQRLEDFHNEHRAGISPPDYTGFSVFGIFGESPFELEISHSVVLHHLHEMLRTNCFHLRWIPDLLTDDFMEKRKTVVGQMILDLEAASQDAWRYLITGDEMPFVSRSRLPNVVRSQRRSRKSRPLPPPHFRELEMQFPSR